MYIRREKGPVSIQLPDGTTMTRADLPARDTKRWVARRKAAVVAAVEGGLVEASDVFALYGISAEELSAWRRAVEEFGPRALKATQVQTYRQP